VTFGQRRSRWAPTDAQRAMLEASYKINEFPDLEARSFLARELGIEARQVQVWFQNRRQKERTRNNIAPRPRAKMETPVGMAMPAPPDSPSSAHSVPLEPFPSVATTDTPFTEPCSLRIAAPVPMEGHGNKGSLSSFSLAQSPPSTSPPRVHQPHALPSGTRAPPAMGPLDLSHDKQMQLDSSTIDRALQLALQQTRQRLYPSPMLKAAAADYFSLERQLGMRLSSRLSNLFAPQSVSSPIAKPAHNKMMRGVPLNRRSISMEALEVLASCMTE